MTPIKTLTLSHGSDLTELPGSVIAAAWDDGEWKVLLHADPEPEPEAKK
jgi:hypothetical protein